MQGCNPTRREHGNAAVAPTVHLSDEIMGHILGAGDEKASRQQIRTVIMRWIRNPKGPVIALCETILHRLLLRGETVMHRQGRKDVLLDVGLIRLPRNRLNDKPQR